MAETNAPGEIRPLTESRGAYLDLSDALAKHLFGTGEYRIGEAVEVAGKIAYLLSPENAYGYGISDDDKYRASCAVRARKFAALLLLIAEDYE